jgi:hypothetical protein
MLSVSSLFRIGRQHRYRHQLNLRCSLNAELHDNASPRPYGEDLVFNTWEGTPLNPENLRNRAVEPHRLEQGGGVVELAWREGERFDCAE